MSRLLFYFSLLLLGGWLWRRMHQPSARSREASRASDKQRANGHHLSSEPIVRCTECGTYVPISQATSLNQQIFRCSEHAQ